MIPKIIHYCWFGGNPLPKEAKKCIESWRRLGPDFEIKEWNEENFDISSNSFAYAAYTEKKWAFVSDYARLKIIYDNGGIYLDVDVRMLKSFNELLDYPAFFGMEQSGYINAGLGFGAEAGNSIVGKLLSLYESEVFNANKINQLACPLLNDKVFAEWGYLKEDKVQVFSEGVIFPPRYFDPIAPGSDKDLTCKDTYSIHLYNASWTPFKSVFKAKIRKLLGPKNVLKLKKILRLFK